MEKIPKLPVAKFGDSQSIGTFRQNLDTSKPVAFLYGFQTFKIR